MKSLFFFRWSLTQARITEGLLMGMIIGLFCSRALLSLSIGLFFLLAPYRLGFRDWLQRSKSDRLVWVFGSLWLLPLLSGIWSADLAIWSDVIRIKLPLLLLPLGWAGLDLSKRSLHRIGWMLVWLTFLGIIYSLLPWFQDALQVKAEYLRGKTLRTPMDNDRVRFSWLVLAMAWWMQGQWKEAGSLGRRCIEIGLLVFIVYLHVLAVRIGLIGLYVLVIFLLWHFFRNTGTRRRLMWLWMLLCVLLPIGIYHTIPTFRARIDYIRYDWSYTSQGKYLPGGNDAIRVQSLQMAAELLRHEPVYGVGFGDIRAAMDSLYLRNNPRVSESDRIYPANEWAVYGVGAGWIGLMLFTGLMLIWLGASSSDRIRAISWSLVTILSLATDIALEVQYGVFLIPFLIFFFRASDRVKRGKFVPA